MAIIPNVNNMVQFRFVSDRHSATEVQTAIRTNCSDVTVKDPIPFNSTNGLRLDTVVQFYRGDSAAMLLQGYDSTGELPGSPGLVPNPPFPSSVNTNTWACLNYTIGESIPLMNAASPLSGSTAFLCIFLLLHFFRELFDL